MTNHTDILDILSALPKPTGPQPRENSVPCPFHTRRSPVKTWNLSGLCDHHEQTA